ncbi:erythromycin esterase family protein [Corallococcus exercitus]|uniref:erythromycin esterase family protein n=1 Tax=Corallococcus exercitus TaxID=2316736 RepID=UPI001FC9A3A9|nr:erythromycin esterase family protein [Corallococcus exercitus]
MVVSDADRIVRDLCDKRLALLGEDSHHGGGTTLTFKVELTRRLVEECHYDAFFIESGTYDFIHLQALLKEGQPVSEDTVASAIGLMWAQQEMKPLVQFLAGRLNAGTLQAGGLDDQIGKGTYANRQMTGELIPFLKGTRQAECGAALERHMAWRYDEAHPYTAESARFILGCWKEVGEVLSGPGAGANPRLQGQLQMVRNLERFFTREAMEHASGTPDWRGHDDRDHSMFMNLEWLLSQSPNPRKAIVWTATVHAAKDLRGVDANERHRTPFGSYVHERFGDQSFVLGFSAGSGSHSLGSSGRIYPLAPAPADSLEGQVLSGHTSNTRYLEGHQLRDLGPRVARPLTYAWMTAPWATVMDGLLIFREETLPHPLPH